MVGHKNDIFLQHAVQLHCPSAFTKIICDTKLQLTHDSLDSCICITFITIHNWISVAFVTLVLKGLQSAGRKCILNFYKEFRDFRFKND